VARRRRQRRRQTVQPVDQQPRRVGAAAELARDLVDPTEDVRGSVGYKRDMAVVFGRRALLAAAARAAGSGTTNGTGG
jgi:CO/xanthine dehydrogenase FAD-binding subunit